MKTNIIFSKISFSSSTSHFLQSFQNNFDLSFNKIHFKNFLENPINLNSKKQKVVTKYFVNDEFDSPLSFHQNSDFLQNMNFFYCAFENCKSSIFDRIAGAISITLPDSSQKTHIRICFCTFSKCTSSNVGNSGAILIRTDSPTHICLNSNCFSSCFSDSYLTFLITSSQSSSSAIVDINETVISKCRIENKKYQRVLTSSISSTELKMKDYNSSFSSASNDVIFKIHNQNSFTARYVMSYSNECQDFCFDISSVHENIENCIVTLRYFNIIDSKPFLNAFTGIGRFSLLSAQLFDFVIMGNPKEETVFAVSRGKPGVVSLYDCFSDKKFNDNSFIQIGEGCVSNTYKQTNKISNIYEKACYFSPQGNIKSGYHFELGPFLIAFLICILLFGIIILAYIIYQRYTKSVNDAIDDDVIGDLSSILEAYD